MDYRIENIESTKVIGAYRHYKSGGHAQSNIPISGKMCIL